VFHVEQRRSSQDEREQLLAELERLRQALPPEQYAQASARIVYRLQRLDRQRYALT
jgi:hypothetical protein